MSTENGHDSLKAQDPGEPSSQTCLPDVVNAFIFPSQKARGRHLFLDDGLLNQLSKLGSSSATKHNNNYDLNAYNDGKDQQADLSEKSQTAQTDGKRGITFCPAGLIREGMICAAGVVHALKNIPLIDFFLQILSSKVQKTHTLIPHIGGRFNSIVFTAS